MEMPVTEQSVSSAPAAVTLPVITHDPRPTVADQVFEALRHRILSLELPPLTKISEAEIARKMGVSRQPVREAFKRLSRLGLLEIRPQSSTKVTLISEEAVLRARFIRTALEVRTCRVACDTRTEEGLRGLRKLIEEQRAAIDRSDRDGFHALDDRFHEGICTLAGAPYVWDLIQDSKAHMDRIRMLSLNTSSQELALAEHIAVLDAIEAGDPDAAERAITRHLSRIVDHIADVKSLGHGFFQDRAT